MSYSKDVNRSLPTEEKIMNVSEMTVAQVAAFYEKWERAGSDYTEGDSLQNAFEAAMFTEPEMDYETEQEAYFSFTKGWLSVREGVPDISKVIIAGMRRMGFEFEYGQNHDTVTFWKFRNKRGELVQLRTDSPRD